MDISPAIATPAKGDPITAAWAAQVAAAVNSSATALTGDESVQTPFGTAEPQRVPPALGAQKYPQPFDAVIYNDSGTDKVAMFLPSGSPSYVWMGDSALSAAPGQSTGNGTTAWVDVESVSSGTRYIYLAIHADSNGDPDGWKLYPTGTADAAPSWAVEGAPMVLLAVYNTSAASFAPSGKVGLNQYHHGSINISDPACCECDDVYSVTEQTGTLPSCVAKRYVFKRQHREIDPETGECIDKTGTGSSETTNIDVPSPPEYELTVTGTACAKTVSLTKTPCGGVAQTAGDTITIETPPTITATSTGSSAGGAKAGTVTVTPCGGTATNIDIYNGADGASGSFSSSIIYFDGFRIYNGNIQAHYAYIDVTNGLVTNTRTGDANDWHNCGLTVGTCS